MKIVTYGVESRWGKGAPEAEFTPVQLDGLQFAWDMTKEDAEKLYKRLLAHRGKDHFFTPRLVKITKEVIAP